MNVIMACICPIQNPVVKKRIKKKNILCTFLVNILAVNSHIKAAWLCDIFETNIGEVKEILFALKEGGFMSRNLSVLSLCSDIMVVDIELLKVNIDKIILYLKSDHLSSGVYHLVFLRKLGQVSINIPEKIVKLLLANLEMIQNQLIDLSNPSFVDLKIDEEFLTPTIFGIALEYPVVYITEREDDLQIESLDLHVIKLDIGINGFKCPLKRHDLDTILVNYSFSVPTEVVSYFESSITTWYTEILTRCTKVNYTCEYARIERNCYVTL